MKGKIRVDAAEASNKVIFEFADGMLGGIAVVDAGRNELEVDLLIAPVFMFEDVRCFIVKSLEDGAKASGNEDS